MSQRNLFIPAEANAVMAKKNRMLELLQDVVTEYNRLCVDSPPSQRDITRKTDFLMKIAAFHEVTVHGMHLMKVIAELYEFYFKEVDSSSRRSRLLDLIKRTLNAIDAEYDPFNLRQQLQQLDIQYQIRWQAVSEEKRHIGGEAAR